MTVCCACPSEANNADTKPANSKTITMKNNTFPRIPGDRRYNWVAAFAYFPLTTRRIMKGRPQKLDNDKRTRNAADTNLRMGYRFLCPIGGSGTGETWYSSLEQFAFLPKISLEPASRWRA